MSGLADALSAVAGSAHAAGLRWYVFGAQAVAAHGLPRATQDLDVTVMVEAAGVEPFVAELGARGVVHRFPAVLPMRHDASGFDIDAVLAGTEIETLAADRAEMRTLAGVRVPVCAAADLAIAKTIAGRPLDMSDVSSLLARGGVDVAEVRRVLRAVERAIGEDGLVAAFDEVTRR